MRTAPQRIPRCHHGRKHPPRGLPRPSPRRIGWRWSLRPHQDGQRCHRRADACLDEPQRGIAKRMQCRVQARNHHDDSYGERGLARVIGNPRRVTEQHRGKHRHRHSDGTEGKRGEVRGADHRPHERSENLEARRRPCLASCLLEHHVPGRHGPESPDSCRGAMKEAGELNAAQVGRQGYERDLGRKSRSISTDHSCRGVRVLPLPWRAGRLESGRVYPPRRVLDHLGP